MNCNCVNIYGKRLNLYKDEVQAFQDMTNNHLAQDCEAGLGFHIVQKVYNRCPLGCTNSKNNEFKKLLANYKESGITPIFLAKSFESKILIP